MDEKTFNSDYSINYQNQIQKMNSTHLQHLDIHHSLYLLNDSVSSIVQLVLTIPNPIDFVKNYDKIGI